MQAEGLHQHRQHQGQRQQQGGADCKAFVAQAALSSLLIIRVRLWQSGVVTGLVDSGNQQLIIECLEHLEMSRAAAVIR